jgi:hypothetical protein
MPRLAKKGELRGTALPILNIGSGWVWVVMTISWSLYLPPPPPGWASGPVFIDMDKWKSRVPTGAPTPDRPARDEWLPTTPSRPAPTHMPAYFRTLDPNTVRGRRYWSRYWDWRSLDLALITHKISTVMVCGSLRLTFSGGSELSVWPEIRYSG